MYHKVIGGKKKKKQKDILKSLDYLLRTQKPEEQKYVKVLSGSKYDIINFNKYSMNSKKENPYICSVLSFEEENISEDLKSKIITEFEDLLFSGIEPENRPPILWVEHRDKGRLELNYLTFNQLQDKRAYTVYYDKSDRKLVNTYTEIINYQYNLSSPLEEKPPEVGSNTLIRKPNTDTPQAKKDFIENINNHILAKIINQELENRNDTIEYIQTLENVKINRIRKNQISIKCDLFADNIPMILKGDIYEENRDYSDYTREYTATISRDPELVKSKLTELERDYTTAIERRTKKNRERYKKPQNKNIQQDSSSLERENTDIEYINVACNPDIAQSQSVLFSHDNDKNNFQNEGVKNGKPDIDKYKNETANEKTRTIEREREIKQIDTQQQYIHSTIKEYRTRQQKLTREIDRTTGYAEIHRKCISGFIRLFERFIRPAQVFTRKAENKKRYEKTYQKEIIKKPERGYDRRRYKAF